MATYLTIVFVIWFATLIHRGSFRSTLPISYRVQNICLSFLLLFAASFDIYAFWWGVFHPAYFQLFFVPKSIFHPLVTVIIMVLGLCAAHLEWIISYGMAQQKKRARSLAVSIAPYLCLVTILRVIQSSGGRQHIAFGLIVLILLSVALYGWLYFFCRSQQSERLMTNVA